MSESASDFERPCCAEVGVKVRWIVEGPLGEQRRADERRWRTAFWRDHRGKKGREKERVVGGSGELCDRRRFFFFLFLAQGWWDGSSTFRAPKYRASGLGQCGRLCDRIARVNSQRRRIVERRGLGMMDGYGCARAKCSRAEPDKTQEPSWQAKPGAVVATVGVQVEQGKGDDLGLNQGQRRATTGWEKSSGSNGWTTGSADRDDHRADGVAPCRICFCSTRAARMAGLPPVGRGVAEVAAAGRYGRVG